MTFAPKIKILPVPSRLLEKKVSKKGMSINCREPLLLSITFQDPKKAKTVVSITLLNCFFAPNSFTANDVIAHTMLKALSKLLYNRGFCFFKGQQSED